MSASYKRHTKFHSKLFQTKDYPIKVDGMEAIVEFSHHGDGRGKERAVYDNAIVLMIQRAFDDILDCKRGQRFLLIDKELCISIVGGIDTVGNDIIISVISAIDSGMPYNPRNTLEIVI